MMRTGVPELTGDMTKSLNTLMVDYHPIRSASVQAANNLVRCELAAAGLAALDALIRKMRPGCCFVVFAMFHGVTLPVLFILESQGMMWRQKHHQVIDAT